MITRSGYLLLIMLFVWIGIVHVDAQTLPPCTERAHWTFDIRAKPERYCVEFVWQDDSAGEMAFTGLAFAPDGRLFAARPLQGQVLMLRDTDGDTQPDSPEVIVEGLNRPNSLLYHEGVLYIAGGTSVYSLTDDNQLTTLLEGLPATGLWQGGLATDGTWLYLGTGASCESCEETQTGTILRLPLEGGESEVFATGFRQPLALLWHDDALWATDSARIEHTRLVGALDELNRVEANSDYGYPACLGLARTADSLLESSQEACDKTVAPVLGLPSYSQPSAMAFYTGEAFPFLQGKLLMGLMGSKVRTQGFGVIAFDFPPSSDFSIEMVLPYDSSITSGAEVPYNPAGVTGFADLEYLNLRGVGLWPRHLYGLAVSPGGWIYLSVGGGTLLSLRPR
jgi:glucose/arabinose dehydrogenase